MGTLDMKGIEACKEAAEAKAREKAVGYASAST